jgi:hypothetical protein
MGEEEKGRVGGKGGQLQQAVIRRGEQEEGRGGKEAVGR